MGIIDEILESTVLPRMIRARQTFPAPEVRDVPAVLREELRKPAISGRVRRGMRIAVAVGSRGVAEIPRIARGVVEELRNLGAEPFIVPGMGSHGGATAEGQARVLADLGVTEESAGCPIVSSMEVAELGALDNGLPVYMDRRAMEADGIVVVNRVKPHTAFSGAIESGLVKMITIGLGKQKGADSCHAYGFAHMERNMIDMAKVKLARAPFLFGVATVENAYDRIARIVAVPAEEILATEPRLLAEARENMPSIPFDRLDVLVVDRMGKDISGSGMDPNITGRASNPAIRVTPKATRIAVLDLTAASHGNAVAMGLADVITRRLFDKIDFGHTYANVLTSTVTRSGMIPLIMDNDRLAIRAAVKTCNARDMGRVRMVRIRDTLRLEEFHYSESLQVEARGNARISPLGPPEEIAFDAEGNLHE
ncbi:MAG: lactate racemase domain-containing protein [Thermodesulfobacteriota bacterium]